MPVFWFALKVHFRKADIHAGLLVSEFTWFALDNTRTNIQFYSTKAH